MRYYKIFIVIALLTVIPLTVRADGWMRFYGGDEADEQPMMEPTSDDGYIIVASTMSFGAGDYDIWLLKIDSNGDTLWTQTYGWGNRDRGISVQETQDGGYIILGTTRITKDNMWLIKTDPAGDTVWTYIYGEIDFDPYCVRQSKDQGYIVLCRDSVEFGFLKTDSLGVVEWTRSYQGLDASVTGATPRCVRCTEDGGYITVGGIAFYVEDSEYTKNLCVFKTDAAGDTLWSRIYGTVEGWEQGNWIEQTSDGGYIVVGRNESLDFGSDLWVLKLNPSGDTVWTRTYGGERTDEGSYVKEIPGGGYIITGIKGVSRPPQCDIWLLKTDTQGDTFWSRDYRYIDDVYVDYNDYGTSVHRMSDGGYLISGYVSEPNNMRPTDLWLLKTDENGIVEIEEKEFYAPLIKLVSTVGPQISLQYSNHPRGFRAEVFDASGRRVDVIRSTPPSGTVTWGEGQPSGVYFIVDYRDRIRAERFVLIK